MNQSPVCASSDPYLSNDITRMRRWSGIPFRAAGSPQAFPFSVLPAGTRLFLACDDVWGLAWPGYTVVPGERGSRNRQQQQRTPQLDALGARTGLGATTGCSRSHHGLLL